MKKINAILFLSIYLFYTTGLHELNKMSTLIEHFHETQKTDSTISFYHFLVMHYVTDDLNDKDNDRDNQLPFKSADSFTSNTISFYIPDLTIQQIAVKAAFAVKPVKLISKDIFIETDFNSIVWHPPQNA